MALRLTLFNSIKHKNANFQIVNRAMAYWNKDWKPGPYPKTQAERIAAAKKYNLVPEDYEPYPDDGMGYGDYPMLPLKSSEARDPNYNWDFPVIRRNYGEPMHVDADAMTEDRWSPDVRKPYSYPVMLGGFLTVFLGMIFLQWFSPKSGMMKELMPKQYPQPGVTHYTFTTKDNNDHLTEENNHLH